MTRYYDHMKAINTDIGRVLQLCGAVICILSFAACSYTPKRTGAPQLVAEPDRVSLMLADAAEKAAKSLETLASIEQYRTPQPTVSTIPNAPQELLRGMSVNWVGPVEPLAEAIANAASYQFNVVGDQPPSPVIVTINAHNRQIIDVLRDLGLQMGMQANLKVNAQRRLIELQYAPTKSARSY